MHPFERQRREDEARRVQDAEQYYTVELPQLRENWRQAICDKQSRRVCLTAHVLQLKSTPQVGVVTLSSSRAYNDIRQVLGSRTLRSVHLDRKEGSSYRLGTICGALREYEGYRDLVVLARGGFNHLDELREWNHGLMIQLVADYKTPIAVATGHAGDLTVLNDVADRSFHTPSHFAAWLRLTIHRRRRLLGGSRGPEVVH